MENSKTYQYRKVMKPMLERKRRARINKCLDSLKDLMIECLTQQGENIARLEKADILELTVDYMKKQQYQRKHELEIKSIENFRNGYIHAANEVSRALAAIPGIDIKLGTTLMTHLGHRLNQIQPSINTMMTINQFEQQHQQQQQHYQSPSTTKLIGGVTINNFMQPLKIETSGSSSSMTSSQISPASSGYHSDLPSPVSSENSYCNVNAISHQQNYCKESKIGVWRPW